MNMAWIHGEFSPPSVPGEKCPACEGDPGKDESTTARGERVQGMTMSFTGAAAHVGQRQWAMQDRGTRLRLPHLCSGSSCCGEHLRAFAIGFHKYFIAIYTHALAHAHTLSLSFPHQSVSLAVTASGRNQMYLRGNIVNVSIFVVVISCSVNTWSK